MDFPIYPELRGGAYIGPVNGRTRMRFQQVTMEQLATILTNQLGRPVADETSLKGKYDFALTYVAALNHLRMAQPEAPL